MNDVMKNYKVKVQMEFGEIRRQIDAMKETFKLTDWTDEKSMIEAANKIWALESRLNDAMEIHKIIMENTEGK